VLYLQAELAGRIEQHPLGPQLCDGIVRRTMERGLSVSQLEPDDAKRALRVRATATDGLCGLGVVCLGS